MGFFGDGLVNGLTGSISNVSRASRLGFHHKNIIPIDGTAAVENLQAVAVQPENATK